MESFNTLYGAILSRNKPNAVAWIKGNEEHQRLSGEVFFYNTVRSGILVAAEIFGLPDWENTSGFYGMHIHEYGDCSNGFQNTGSHYNPDNFPHPMHAGDLPPLLSYKGYAWMAFYDHRFSIKEILGKSLVIHDHRDDFMSQPAGDSGEKIGCGVIERFR